MWRIRDQNRGGASHTGLQECSLDGFSCIEGKASQERAAVLGAWERGREGADRRQEEGQEREFQ